jgi:hypothetical protein
MSTHSTAIGGMATERERAILAAVAGANANVDWLTNDRIEALTGGHGMLNLPVIAIADALAVELLRGADLQVKFANVAHQPIDDLLTKAIDAARLAGADSANAALLSAALLYLAGAQAQVGIPAGNRKLGATARMIAGVDRCGVAAIPTGKKNNKISGFPAVAAVYRAMGEGQLSPIDGRSVPTGVRSMDTARWARTSYSLQWPRTGRASGRKRCSMPWPALGSRPPLLPLRCLVLRRFWRSFIRTPM